MVLPSARFRERSSGGFKWHALLGYRVSPLSDKTADRNSEQHILCVLSPLTQAWLASRWEGASAPCRSYRMIRLDRSDLSCKRY